jgi:acetyl-CoA carboxylase carboxyl transferase subunit alpha
MKTTFLDFEQSVAELETKIEELRFVQDESSVDISDELKTLSEKSQQLTKELYENLSPWQVSQVSRHPQRPYTLDYVSSLFTDFHELHGDRTFADDQSIIGGLARFNGAACMVIGHQKGRDTKERALRNFGMSRPEGYRKAMRLMRLAEKFQIPVFTFVDTPGAFPGIDAEERNQSEAIGHNLYTQAELTVPIITTIIGEGGSGGAFGSSFQPSSIPLAFFWSRVMSSQPMRLR